MFFFSKGHIQMSQQIEKGTAEIHQSMLGKNRIIYGAVLFSIFFNILMLTSPLYMLQVYDRVLGSKSEATLVALSLLVLFLFIIMGIFDYTRSRTLAFYGVLFNLNIGKRVFDASLTRASLIAEDKIAKSAQRDIHSIQQFWSSPIASALIDLPWTPVFLIALFIFHPILGWFAVGGGMILVSVALANQRYSKKAALAASSTQAEIERISDRARSNASMLNALGMRIGTLSRWENVNEHSIENTIKGLGLSSLFTALSKTLRLFLQSAILGVGAWLALHGEISPGAMIAGSILMGRALQPIEQVIGQLALLARARESYQNLAILLSQHPAESKKTTLPRPQALLEVEELAVIGSSTPTRRSQKPILQGVSFKLEPGKALGVIGPSGAGKTTLGRVIVSAIQPAAGKVLLNGAKLDQYDSNELGKYIGYLPQRVTLFDGSIAQNIARLSPNASDKKIIAAAMAADAHEMILQLPNGYDTPVFAISDQLSGGQMQRIALARALYEEPVILVLDEPNSNLDGEGSAALNTAIKRFKSEGRAVIVIAHRPAAIHECDQLLMLSDGRVRAYGPRDEVLKRMTQNHTEIIRARSQLSPQAGIAKGNLS